jgi:cephalosporin hydroxylase
MKMEQIFEGLKYSSTKWSGYFDVYEHHLAKFRGKAPRILEIGVLGGGSIEMWHKYFGPGTFVVGIDINPDCEQYTYEGDTKIVIGDQGNPEFWKAFTPNFPEFDIIIDDGGHEMDQQLTTLQYTYPTLKEGGVYIVEDTHTSYWPDWGGAYGKQETFLNRSKQITDVLNQQHFTEPHIDQEILNVFSGLYSVTFYNSMVVFEKRKLKPFYIKDNTTVTLNIG